MLTGTHRRICALILPLALSAMTGCGPSNPTTGTVNGIPTENDWRSEPWDLDVPNAYKHFFGKSREEARMLFVENAIYYQEDVMFMPRRCFGYYLHSYIDYLMSDDARGDSDGASCFFGLVEIRADDISSLEDPDQKRVVELLSHLGARQGWYDADEEIYGDFSRKAEHCINLIQ
tara:strand:- start:2689 stop:3213 length:525 start_codon:yes stop_codon:yes gene_type:complete